MLEFLSHELIILPRKRTHHALQTMRK